MQAINNSKIKYLQVTDKVYEIMNINFSELTLEATETDLLISDVPVEEVFPISDFSEFHIKLRNWCGNVINFEEFRKNRKSVF